MAGAGAKAKSSDVVVSEENKDVAVGQQIAACLSAAAIDMALNYAFTWLDVNFIDDNPNNNFAIFDFENIWKSTNKWELTSSVAIACGASVFPFPTDKQKLIATVTASFGAGAVSLIGDIGDQYDKLPEKMSFSDKMGAINWEQAFSKAGETAFISGVSAGITLYSLDHPKFKNFAKKLQLKGKDRVSALLKKSGFTDDAIATFCKKMGVNGVGSVLEKYRVAIFDKVKIIAKDESLLPKIKNSFLDSYYYTGETIEAIGVFRRFGGNESQAKLFGSFSTTEAVLSRNDLAILKEWSTMQFEAELVIEKGAKLNMGKIAQQSIYSGGADQVLLPRNYPDYWVKSIKDLKTGKVYSLEEFKIAFPNQIK